ncbi:endonuclease domain-containing protein [Solimonas soli]|uniref:endonuclease domain-containing protein n=1 Tax=Solimonas soli TaxID=413479 RepID=UPI0005BB15C0
MTIRTRTRRARELRRNATSAEQRLWFALRQRYGPQCKIRRQHPIGTCIADFAIPAHRLVIEIDGGQHALHGDADARRTAALRDRGYRVIRFWNNEVMENLDGVMEAIELALAEDAGTHLP